MPNLIHSGFMPYNTQQGIFKSLQTLADKQNADSSNFESPSKKQPSFTDAEREFIQLHCVD